MKKLLKIGVVLKDSNSKNENDQEIVPIEIDSEDDTFQSNIRALPNSNKFSSNMMETLGSLMSSKNSWK